jgi:hypothetical protein
MNSFVISLLVALCFALNAQAFMHMNEFRRLNWYYTKFSHIFRYHNGQSNVINFCFNKRPLQPKEIEREYGLVISKSQPDKLLAAEIVSIGDFTGWDVNRLGFYFQKRKCMSLTFRLPCNAYGSWWRMRFHDKKTGQLLTKTRPFIIYPGKNCKHLPVKKEKELKVF